MMLLSLELSQGLLAKSRLTRLLLSFKLLMRDCVLLVGMKLSLRSIVLMCSSVGIVFDNSLTNNGPS